MERPYPDSLVICSPHFVLFSLFIASSLGKSSTYGHFSIVSFYCSMLIFFILLTCPRVLPVSLNKLQVFLWRLRIKCVLCTRSLCAVCNYKRNDLVSWAFSVMGTLYSAFSSDSAYFYPFSWCNLCLHLSETSAQITKRKFIVFFNYSYFRWQHSKIRAWKPISINFQST
jgi:hypothetical protein